MKPWMLSELKDVLQTDIPVEAEITCVSTDTRDMPAGCLFVALEGKRFDGHAFVPDAIAAGAVAAVTAYPIEGYPCIAAGNTDRALMKIAGFYRAKFHPFLTAVTGSVGKTTTKEMIACVLESQFRTLKTQGNLNNEIGLPKTLMQLEDSHEAAVVEMGMSGFGEISRMSQAARPDVGVITNIGFSHIESLGSQKAILRAKAEIMDGMAPDAPLIINGDDPYLIQLKHSLTRPVITYGMSGRSDVHAVSLVRKENQTAFSIVDDDGVYPVVLPCAGDHNVMNAMAAFCVGRQAGIAPEQICDALKDFHTVGMRQNIYKKGAYTIIADCYNASPDSMWAALSVLGRTPCTGKRIAVLGDMLELGDMAPTLHRRVGEMVSASNVDYLFCYGKNASSYLAPAAVSAKTASYLEKGKLCQAVRSCLRPGDTILFKASRGMHLEECIDTIFELEEN